MMAMTMKADACFARDPEAEDAQGKDGGEHDGHEEIAQEDGRDRPPAELAGDQQGGRAMLMTSVETEDPVRGEPAEEPGAGEAAGEKTDESQARPGWRRPCC